MKALNNIVNYLYVGAIPNIISAFSVGSTISNAMEGDRGGLVWGLIAVGCNTAMGALKYEEYKKVRKALEEHGWDERLVKPKTYSLCQRHAARQAAKHTGYISEFDDFMEKEGHKWYHGLPKVHRFNEMSH